MGLDKPDDGKAGGGGADDGRTSDRAGQLGLGGAGSGGAGDGGVGDGGASDGERGKIGTPEESSLFGLMLTPASASFSTVNSRLGTGKTFAWNQSSGVI